MDNPEMRLPYDIDYVYLEPLENVEEARSKFDEWAIQITEQTLNDGVSFRNFKENAFWRRIEYAMSDDFPTINTDIAYSIAPNFSSEIHFDLSFNLDIDVPPVPLIYEPRHGKSFILPYTVPLALQVSWKLHQTLVRPRFKDLFDLIHLVNHASFDTEMLYQTLDALAQECRKDKVESARFYDLLKGDWYKIFKKPQATWDYWRHEIHYPGFDNDVYGGGLAKHILLNTAILPANLETFKQTFLTALHDAGFGAKNIHW